MYDIIQWFWDNINRSFLLSPPLSGQLVDAVKEQEENNYRLRQYMDKIILAILDHNPSILEIKKE